MTILFEVLKRDGTERVYEAHQGQYVEVQGRYSANPYWHDLDHYSPAEGDRIVRRAQWCLMNDSGDVVGYYGLTDGIRELFEYYLREPILAEVEVA